MSNRQKLPTGSHLIHFVNSMVGGMSYADQSLDSALHHLHKAHAHADNLNEALDALMDEIELSDGKRLR